MTRANLNAARDTTQRYWAGFVEDSWPIGNRHLDAPLTGCSPDTPAPALPSI